MKVSEAFLVNTKNFDSIIDALVAYKADEPVINSTLLEDLCYSDPNDLLVVRLLKDFKIITSEGKPGKHYEEFHNPSTTKKALAKGLVEAYGPLFDNYQKIYQEPLEKIKEAFEELFDGKKTDLIIKYISGTFHKVVTFVGVSTLDAVLKQDLSELTLEPSTMEAELDKNHRNGNSLRKSEEISDKHIDDFVTDFDAKRSSDTPDEDVDEKNEADLTVREYIKNEKEEDDPFNFNDLEDNFTTTTAGDEEKIDKAPFDLEVTLSSVGQNNSPMNTLAKEHDFIQTALLRKSDLLHKMHRWEELVPALEEIIKRYDNEEHPKLEDAVSRSIIRRAIALLKLNRTEEALPALNSVISRFKNSENQEFFDQASRAMLYKVQILEKTGSPDLLPLYNSIIDRLDSTSEILMKEKLDEIHLKRFDLIITEAENNEVLDACTKLIKRFANSDEYQEYLQKAMIKRAEMLDSMERYEEALKAYDDFLAAFGK